MTIPYKEAAQSADDVFNRVAEKLYASAQAATSEYIAQHLPACETVAETHADGKYRRTVRTAAGKTHTVSYDYRTKSIEAA